MRHWIFRKFRIMHRFEFKMDSAVGKGNSSGVLTTDWGAPLGDGRNSLQAGMTGQVLVDPVLIAKNQAFNRERIPERVVHAQGVSAHGTFQVTDPSFAEVCKADLFSSAGKTTPVVVRFSAVVSDRFSADTGREPRGFAIKFYTGEGNWDLVMNNAPMFFIRDPMLFPDIIHSQKRNPATGLRDGNAYWDFLAHTPESVHLLLAVFGDRGIPASYRHMNGYGNHAFRVVNTAGGTAWVKFHVKTDSGVKCLTSEAAETLAGRDPDFLRRDLTYAIEDGNFPIYTMFAQVIPDADVAGLPYDIFDVTKVVPHADYPLREIGKLTLNRCVDNDFAENEQVAFSVGHLVPGIEASPDKVLQGRLFAYHDTQLHRLGPNFLQLPINRPLCPVRSHTRDGPMCMSNQLNPAAYFTGDPATGGPQGTSDRIVETSQIVEGLTGRKMPEATARQCVSDFDQPRELWSKVLTEDERDRMTSNLAASLKKARPEVQAMALARLFAPVSSDLASAVRSKIARAGQDHPTAAMPPSGLMPVTHLCETATKFGNSVLDLASGPPTGKAVGAAPTVGEAEGGQPVQLGHLSSQAAVAGVPGKQHPLLKGKDTKTGMLGGLKNAVAHVGAGVAGMMQPGEGRSSKEGRRD